MWKILVHGGAGVISRKQISSEQETQYRYSLQRATQAGARLLEDHAPAMDGVVAAVQVLEDDPLFNAGRGSVFTHEGTIEMDAAVMNGSDRGAGAVCVVRRLRNPILAARAVWEEGHHVLLSGIGAEEFSREKGLDFEDQSYFETEHRKQQLETARTANRQLLDHEGKFGTVGAVAIDITGNIAAATSTGGMTNKRYGRVGDSPLIGAGTWADSCNIAVSATGHGEAFIRLAAARTLAAYWEYHEQEPATAGELVLEELAELGGVGGFIIIDNQGHWAMPFNSEGMFRAVMEQGGKCQTGIYSDDPV